MITIYWWGLGPRGSTDSLGIKYIAAALSYCRRKHRKKASLFKDNKCKLEIAVVVIVPQESDDGGDPVSQIAAKAEIR